MPLHLIDGTYELFRAYFALPSLKAPDGREVGAARGLAQTLLSGVVGRPPSRQKTGNRPG